MEEVAGATPGARGAIGPASLLTCLPYRRGEAREARKKEPTTPAAQADPRDGDPSAEAARTRTEV